VLYQIIEKPFSGILRSFLAIVAAAVIGAMIASGLIAAIPGIFGVGIAAIAAGLATIFMGLVFERSFDLGLLRMLAEPFPRAAAAIGNFMGAK
jgi:hypothetical protein